MELWIYSLVSNISEAVSSGEAFKMVSLCGYTHSITVPLRLPTDDGESTPHLPCSPPDSFSGRNVAQKPGNPRKGSKPAGTEINCNLLDQFWSINDRCFKAIAEYYSFYGDIDGV